LFFVDQVLEVFSSNHGQSSAAPIQ